MKEGREKIKEGGRDRRDEYRREELRNKKG